ncbi:MAG: hypothetical protein V8R62_04020 [Faecalibacillus intestinalis]
MKKGYWSRNCKKDEMAWALTVKKVPNDAKNVFIKDTLPENTQYVNNSLEVYTVEKWESQIKNEDIIKDIQIENENKNIKFIFTNKALDYLKTNYMKLMYKTSIIDISNALGNKAYKNNASLSVDGKYF